MNLSTITIAGREIPVYRLDTVIIGSGCAGFNAADTLFDLGRKDIAIITEGVRMGTSRNTGSDKQTFYKLSLSPDEPDSVGKMARTLFDCGGMHGDTALVEAACSVRSFMKLVNYGVPFPTDRYGAFVGYKTDHDPEKRGTSAGPYTSRYMTEKLEKKVTEKGITIFDGMTAVRLITCNNTCFGVVAIDEKKAEESHAGLTVFLSSNTILATGGPAGIYSASVYPESQTGMTGMAIEAGAECTNLMDWQYGIASLCFRWNLSGTYQQVLPRYISIDENGMEHEFLYDYFSDPMQAVNLVFLKGYQWPFDVRKISGSSLIDLIVHHETADLGHRVFLDYRQDPACLRKNGFSALSEEAYRYLERSGALIDLPINRLEKMNPAAVALYKDHGIDLYAEPLEIGVCAQHNNGGLSVDTDWMTTVQNLYAVGEAAGTFGAYRPGGTALASTQTGSLRAAEKICYTTKEHLPDMAIIDKNPDIPAFMETLFSLLNKDAPSGDIALFRKSFQEEMSRYASHIRNPSCMRKLLNKCESELVSFFREKNASKRELSQLLRNRDILLTQGAVLSAMIYSSEIMQSHGSGLVIGDSGQETGIDGIRFLPPKHGNTNLYIATVFDGKKWNSKAQAVRNIPDTDTWFENVWSDYRRRTGQ